METAAGTPIVAGDATQEAGVQAPEATTQERLFSHCELGQYEEIAALVQSGRRNLFVNCVNSRGETPLHAVRDVRCAELLLESGGSHAALNRQNGDGETPLMVSLRLGNVSLAGLYLDNGADIRPPNRHFQSCLHAAALSGMVETLDRLLSMRQLDPNQHDRMGNATLHYAVTYVDKERACGMLERLLQESQLTVDSVDSLCCTAFALAAQSGNLAACRLLRDRGCDLCHADANGANALHLSSAMSGPETVRYLVSDLAFSVDHSDKLGRTALFYAAHHATEDTLVELLALGADPNRTDRLGRSPVHVVADKGHDACLARLLAAGAQPWLLDAVGQTPLHLAASNGRRDVVKRLLRCDRAGDFLESRDTNGLTASDLASRQPQQQPVVELLAQAIKSHGQQQLLREQQRRSYPRPRSAAAKAREAEANTAKKGLDLSVKKDNKEKLEPKGEADRAELPHRSYPRPMSSVTRARHAENETKHMEEKQRLERGEEECAEADEFVSDEDKRDVYPRDNEVALPVETAKQERHNETSDEGISAEKKVDTNENVTGDELKVGPPQSESTPTSTLHSTSASSLKRLTVIDGDGPASGGNSSRPSSHLEEELHGKKRDREAEDRKHDPYLTAKPTWITGLPVTKSVQQQQQQPRLRRSKKEAPNVAALRQRLYMYDSTVMLGRVLNEERRERMLLRGGAQLPQARLQLQQPQQPQRHSQQRRRHLTRPSTAADAERLSDRYHDINVESRQLLDKWKSENDSYAGVDRRTPRTRSSSGERSGAAVAADVSGRRRERTPERRRRGRPYRRPQSGSRFLDYFPNNQPGGGGNDAGGGGDGRRGRAKSAAKSRDKTKSKLTGGTVVEP